MIRLPFLSLEIWKRDLLICCIASFIVSVGMSQMAPILPLYIHELGIEDPDDVARWAGIVFGCNFVSLAIFSPIWGRLADKYGRKPMILRASGWLGLIMIALGFTQSVWQLAGLRLLQGAMSGFQAAVIPFIAAETPQDKSGWAMSMFFAAQVTGSLLGPVLGGGLSEMIGYRHTFFLIGAFCLLGCASLTLLRETQRPQVKATPVTSTRETFASLPYRSVTLAVFATTFLMHFSISFVQPILTVYVAELAPDAEHLAVISGFIFSCSGIASMLFASRLGHLSDRLGAHRVLLGSLILAGIISFPQGLISTVWGLGILRFIHGIAMAGLIPATNGTIRQVTPADCLGRIYGFNQSAQFIGMFTGAFLGGQLTAWIGFAHTFFLVGALLLINALWCKTHVVNTLKTETQL